MSIPYSDNIVLLNAVSTSTVSDAYDISKRQQVTMQFIASDITSGNGVFTLDVSNDGSNWVTGIAFLDAKQTAVSTFVVSKTLSSDISEGAIVIPGWKFIRASVLATTDGSYSAIMQNGG